VTGKVGTKLSSIAPQGLLDWLRRARPEKGCLQAEGAVRLSVNRQFREPFTKLDAGDEGVAKLESEDDADECTRLKPD
jgi:hypothetical protein